MSTTLPNLATALADRRALSLLEEAVNQGFHPYHFIAGYCPFMAPLSGLPRFEALAARAQRLTAEFPK